ncbi:hypothetical protein CMI37_22295 [Candidatus Pacearchaeota archaeon]|nr:hypothetical protein [Candidatus Pacearchaeota archaeon]|tara:strand:- start:2658 stop:4907 length:2250 start_codon:yes stop_codon:yes gene_type:complete
MGKLSWLLIIAFLLILPFSFAIGTTTYRQAGGEGFDWNNEGRGTFSGIGTNINTFGKSVSAPFQIPIIDDFDNNSISDLFVLDGDTAKIYQNKELDIIASLDIGAVPTSVSNIISFDIDGDGTNEIVFADNTNNIMFMLNFSQSEGLVIEHQFDVTINEFPMIACRLPNECIVTVDSTDTEDIFVPFTAFYRAYSFDSTNLTSGLTTIYSEFQPSSDAIALCSPRNQNIPVVDIDGDGISEFGVSIGTAEDSDTDAKLRFFWMDNLTIDVSGTRQKSATASVGCTGSTGVSNLVTSPLGANLFTAHSGVETFIGLQSSASDFRIQGFKSDGSFFDEFPETILSEGDGTMISNVFLMNAFPATTGALDFCVLGYAFTDQEIDLVCGTEDRGFLIPQTSEFKFPVANLFNISTDIDKKDNIVHAVQHSNALTNLQDLNEIISAYGIFTVDFVGTNELLRIFQNPQGDSVLLSIDLEQFGADDLIALTDTNIIYMDDKVSNEPAQIDDLTFNPCVVNSVIKVNESLQVSVDASDTNDAVLGFDNLTISISVYDGTSNQQNVTNTVTTSQVDGSTTVIESFNLNETGFGNVIRVEAFDTGNPTEVASVEQTFTVNINGIEFGDATCTLTVTAPDEDEINVTVEAGTLTVDATENSITTGIQTVIDLTGLAGTTFWLLLMLAFSMGIYFRGSSLNWSGNSTLGAIALVNVLFIVLGARVGVISTGLIVIMVVVSVVILGVFLGRFLTGVGANAE